MKLKVDEERAFAVFKALEKPYVNDEGVYKQSLLPQNRFPLKAGEKEQGLWYLFWAPFERGGTVSGDATKFLWQLRLDLPELFDPKTVANKWTPEKIEGAFKAIAPKVLNGNGIGETGAGALGLKLNEQIQSWHRNATTLHKYWGGDIRNVFWGVVDFEEAFRRVDYKNNPAGFKGMRRKIFSLLTIWMQEKNLIPFFPAPIPVDFHAMRVLWETDILKLDSIAKPIIPTPKQSPHLKGKVAVRVSEKFMDRIAMWSQEFLPKHGLSHLTINPANWLHSRHLCADAFQNSVRGDKKEMQFIETEQLKKDHSLWPKNYKDPCSHCVLECWCSWAIPWGPFYRWGFLTRVGRRVPYPAQKLPGIIANSDYRSRKSGRK